MWDNISFFSFNNYEVDFLLLVAKESGYIILLFFLNYWSIEG